MSKEKCVSTNYGIMNIQMFLHGLREFVVFELKDGDKNTHADYLKLF